MRAAPSAASRRTIAPTSTSRLRVSTPNQTGTAPWTMITMTAVPTSSRSASGSSTLPSVETWWKRRATNPSTQSVAPRTASRMAAGPWSLAPKTSQTKTGRQASRTVVMRLGIVRIALSSSALANASALRRGPHAADSTIGGRFGAARSSGRPGSASGRLWEHGRSMPRFSPFRGLRYDPQLVHLAQVIAPALRRDRAGRTAAAGRSLARSTRSTSSCPSPTCGPASTATRWRPGCWRPGAGTESSCPRRPPAYYLYRDGGRRATRTLGVIGALGLPEEGEEGEVLPHEETLPKPRSDRLRPVSGRPGRTSPPSGGCRSPPACRPCSSRGPSPIIDVYDDDGVRHQLWVVDESDRAGRSARPSGAAPVVIADGHHRYETARTVPARGAGGTRRTRPGGHDWVMALDRRALRGPADRRAHPPGDQRAGPAAAISSRPSPSGSTWCGPATAPTGWRTRWASRRLARGGHDRGRLAAHRPRPRPTRPRAATSTRASWPWRWPGSPRPRPTHRHSWSEAVESVRTRRRPGGGAACARRPSPRSPSGPTRGRRMPPKTTYFSPKPRTGMVFRPLEG